MSHEIFPLIYPTSNPTGSGYGGSGYGTNPYGGLGGPLSMFVDGGYGGDPYGFGPYGAPLIAAPAVDVDGGYGGAAYGLSPYGSIDTIPPGVSSAVSVDGLTVEVFFSEEMEINAALTDISNYTISVLSGAAATTVLSVTVNLTGEFGATSVLVTHTGTTLAGIYEIEVLNVEDINGNLISAAGSTASFLALGDPATFTVTPQSGTELLLEFDYDMIPESTISGIEQSDNYSFETGYPIQLTVGTITHPNGVDDSQVVVEVTGMTSTTYTATISPATAIDYAGDELPSASADFTGVEVGTGTSTVIVDDLKLTKAAGVSYGWAFQDTSGKVLPSSSYRVDFTFDSSLATYTPSLTNAVLGTFSFSDGSVEVTILVERIAGNDTLTVNSGAYSQAVSASWSAASSVISVVRNQLADTYAVLFNGTPLISTAIANWTGVPTISAGAQFLLGTTYAVSGAGFLIESLEVTSTQTIFTSAWNFLHNQVASFTGSAADAVATFPTACGPLTKGWGDGTPATKQDVTVTIDGTEVEIASVNPYLAQITPTIPIPKFTPGDHTVLVDYYWIPTPTMYMKLNTPGAVLNKWSNPKNVVDPIAQLGNWGFTATTPHPLRLVIGPSLYQRSTPQWIGHRYLGYERAQTASLNDPTSLLLNQNPRATKAREFIKTPKGVSIGYDGESAPDSDGWTENGSDTGMLNEAEGTYTVIDASSGTLGQGTAAFYTQDLSGSLPATLSLATRLVLDSSTPDGVFTGVGFGVHTNRRLFLVGLVLVNGLQHAGVLIQPAEPESVDSWVLGPSVTLDIQDSTTCIVDTEDFPVSVEIGDRFQVLSGSQTGVYTIENFVNQSDGTTTVTVESASPFPGNPFLWAADTAEAVFEVPHSVATTYRMVLDTATGALQVYVSGEIAGLVASLDSLPATPQAAQTAFLFSQDGEGQVFWGSVGRVPVNQSTWSFFRYGLTPAISTFQSLDVVVETDMSVVPEDDPNSEWFLTEDFGYTTTDGTDLLLKSTASEPVQDVTYGYGRIEPYLEPGVNLDFDGTIHMDWGTQGFGDAQVRILDGSREIRFGTIHYIEFGTPHRQLAFFPSTSLSGLYTPENAGWQTSGADISASVRNQKLTTTQTVGQTGTWYSDLDLSGLNYTDEGGRIIEARFRVNSYTANGSGSTGIIFGGEVGDGATNYLIGVTLTDAPAVVLTSNGTPIQTFSFDWDDGEFHNYRILADFASNAVVLKIDDVVQTPTVTMSLFDVSASNTMCFMGAFNTDSAHSVVWDSVSSHVAAPTTGILRTFGVWLGGDMTDINNFALPRSDGTDALNEEFGAIVQEMDWRYDCEFRVHLDGGWGLVIYRPDLPSPPLYVPGQFATQITEPSAGWIQVEYPRLPVKKSTFGVVEWGALNPASVTQSRWGAVSYRLFDLNAATNDYLISPRNMVLNKAHVLTSGEGQKDITPEIVQVTSLTSTMISLRPSNISAKTVFKVIDDQTLIPFEEWTFNQETQTIHLDSPLSGEHVPVTVVFGPGAPFTRTYLELQPLLDSCHLLNEGTPIFERAQVGSFSVSSTTGSTVEDSSGSGDTIDNSQFNYVTVSQNPEYLYTGMEFFEVENDGAQRVLSSFCDDTHCGSGLGIELSGALFSETFNTPTNGFAGSGGGGLGGGSLSPLSSFYGTLYVSGGGYSDGTIGPGTANLVANYPAIGIKPPPGNFAPIQQALTISLEMTAVFVDSETEADLEEDLDSANTFGDNVPPEFSEDPDLAPDGVAGTEGNGAVLAVLEVAGDNPEIGPGSGYYALQSDSLLAGGSFDTTSSMLLVGGSAIAGPVRTVFNIESAN